MRTVNFAATVGEPLSNASAVAGAAPVATSGSIALVKRDTEGVVMSSASRVGFRI